MVKEITIHIDTISPDEELTKLSEAKDLAGSNLISSHPLEEDNYFWFRLEDETDVQTLVEELCVITGVSIIN